MFDATLISLVRVAAIDAFNRIAPSGEAAQQTLLEMLESIDSQRDPDGELAGTLLHLLYRRVILPPNVWRYAVDRPGAPIGGDYWRFWNETLLEDSDTAELCELLNGFADDPGWHFRGYGRESLDDIPVRVLVRVLQESEGRLPTADIYRWLCAVTSDVRVSGYQRESRRKLLEWLSAHPAQRVHESRRAPHDRRRRARCHQAIGPPTPSREPTATLGTFSACPGPKEQRAWARGIHFRQRGAGPCSLGLT